MQTQVNDLSASKVSIIYLFNICLQLYYIILYLSNIFNYRVYQAKLEAEVSVLRNKVQSLQVELDNSEAVQRDFVKLSQSLQVIENQ